MPEPAAPAVETPSVPDRRELTPEEIGDFEGSEMLIGATKPVEEPAAEDEPAAPAPEPTAEATPEPAPDAAPEPEPETTPADAATDEAAWPEPAKARLAELSKERDELRAKLETAAPVPVTGPVATPTDPLADVLDEALLTERLTLAERLEDWADEHRDGGELPRDLQAALEGKKPEEIEFPRDLSGDEARQLYRNAKTMLRKHIPARREFLQHARGNEAWMRTEFPEFFDTSTPEGQLFAQFERDLPQIKQIARWPAALASLVAGHRLLTQRLEAKAKGSATAPNGSKAAAPAQPPRAPVPPSTGQRGASTAKPSTVSPRRETALSADMTDEQIMAAM